MTIPVINKTLKNGKIRKLTIDQDERLKEIDICVQEKMPDQDLSMAHRNAINVKHDEIAKVVNAMIIAAKMSNDIVKFKDDTYELMDDYIKLKALLDDVPESSNIEEFDQNLETRRKVWRQLHKRIEDIGSKIEQEWASKLWDKVKDKGPIEPKKVSIDGE